MVIVIAWILYGLIGNYIFFRNMTNPNEDTELWFVLLIVALSPIITSFIIFVVIATFLDETKVTLEDGRFIIRRKK
jgi:hypothetical protein